MVKTWSGACMVLVVGSVMTAMLLSTVTRLVDISVTGRSRVSARGGHLPTPFNHTILSDSPQHLFWFLQVTDLHVSSFHDPTRIDHLRQFCDSTVAVIRPSLVLASGDLTDAKESNNIGSAQMLDEWTSYNTVLSRCKSLQTIDWIDIRGNHDNFDVPGGDSVRNLYVNYSVHSVGRGHSFFYRFVTAEGMIYKFIGLDACPDQGLRRPFNFAGLLRRSDISLLRQMIASDNETDYFIWFGHYPTSCILSQEQDVREVIGEDSRTLVYLCGHLHTLGGLVPNMYTLHPQGFLELELADWKDNRMYRVVAVDHRLLSFTDVKFEEWPVVLITNPKRSLHAPLREPLHTILLSTHLRVLVFSPGAVVVVKVSLDDGEWEAMVHSQGPLYTAPWRPTLYKSGLHIIKVSAVDDLGNEQTVKEEFCLDGSHPFRYSSYLARLSLTSHIASLSQVLFGLAMVTCILPLCLFRYLTHTHPLPHQGDSTTTGDQPSGFFLHWAIRLHLFSKTDKLFYPSVIYPLYITIGPWFVGEVMRGHTGVVFIWGTFVNNSFLPGVVTYVFAFYQLVFYHAPLILLSAYILHYRVRMRRKEVSVVLVVLNMCMSVVVSSQFYLIYYVWTAYGTMAAILDPYRLYPALLFLYLWYQVSFRRVDYLWAKES